MGPPHQAQCVAPLVLKQQQQRKKGAEHPAALLLLWNQQETTGPCRDVISKTRMAFRARDHTQQDTLCAGIYKLDGVEGEHGFHH